MRKGIRERKMMIMRMVSMVFESVEACRVLRKRAFEVGNRWTVAGLMMWSKMPFITGCLLASSGSLFTENGPMRGRLLVLSHELRHLR